MLKLNAKKVTTLFLLIAMVLSSFTASFAATSKAAVNPILKLLYDDMHLTHEGKPHGVPESFEWFNGPMYRDMLFPTTVYEPVSKDPHQWNNLTAWGQVYEAREGTKSVNTRVQLKNMDLYYLSKKDNTWHQLQYQKAPTGGAYAEDFAADNNVQADIRFEADGSISVIPGGGRNFHFFPNGRAQVDPTDVVAICASVNARLVKDKADGPDDRDKARFVMDVGSDLWYDAAVEWDNFKTNTDSGLARFRYVTDDWQLFTTYSIVKGMDILKCPPPPLTLITNKYEAEKAVREKGIITAQYHNNFSGTGYSSRFTKVGAGISFSIDADVKGDYDIALRYGNASGKTRTISIYVNGVKIKQTSLGSLSNWSKWGEKIETVALEKGKNTVSYKVDKGDSGYVNLDCVTVEMKPKAPEKTSDALYFNNFDDDTAKDWLLPTGISVSDKTLHSDAWDANPVAVYNGVTLTGSYKYTLDIITYAGSGDNRIQPVFNYKDDSNYYFLDLGAGNAPEIYLKKLIDGQESIIATSQSHFSIVGPLWSTLSIEYQEGGLMTVTASQPGNNEVLFSKVKDTDITSGKIGVTVKWCVAAFDNITISK